MNQMILKCEFYGRSFVSLSEEWSTQHSTAACTKLGKQLTEMWQGTKKMLRVAGMDWCGATVYSVRRGDRSSTLIDLEDLEAPLNEIDNN